MKLIKDLNEIAAPFRNSVITIGNFDGVHKGHQALIAKGIETAKAIDGTSIVITFDPHPLRILRTAIQLPLITLTDQKIELIEKTGADVLVVIPFTKEFSAIPPETFIADMLVKTIGMKAIIVGRDYAFGKNKQGNTDLLKKLGTIHGFDLIIPEWVTTENDMGRISSTRIRETIQSGAVEEAPRLLGRHYQIKGEVVSGRNRGGRLLGFPTANLNLVDELCPKTGVYAVTVETPNGNFNGVANIGYSPTFDDYLFTVEVHLLDFDDDIYGREIRVNLIEKLRDEKKFSSIETLSAQIHQDIENARRLLAPKEKTL